MYKIYLVGCLHGRFDEMYKNAIEKSVDLIIACGDLQCIRKKQDIKKIPGNNKKFIPADFIAYCNGEKIAPILTICVGGNHENSEVLWELYNGGWLAKNIYFIGYSGVINVDNIKICGLSGIYKFDSYYKPYIIDNDKVKIYHVRDLECQKLKLLGNIINENYKIDIVVSHDWPSEVWKYGDKNLLFKKKGSFKKDIDEKGYIGSPAHQEIMDLLKPKYWISGHHHIKYKALKNNTCFIAADIVGKNEDCEILELDLNIKKIENEAKRISLDPVWLSIIKIYDNIIPNNINDLEKIRKIDKETIERQLRYIMKREKLHIPWELKLNYQKEIIKNYLITTPSVKLPFFNSYDNLELIDIGANLYYFKNLEQKKEDYKKIHHKIKTDEIIKIANLWSLSYIIATSTDFKSLDINIELCKKYSFNNMIMTTIGIHPTSVDTVFGKIKPDQLKMAEKILDKYGDYGWNECMKKIEKLEICDTIKKSNENIYLKFSSYLKELPKFIISIGEIGLDYHIDRLKFSDKDSQRYWLKAQLIIFKDLNIPLFLHCRDAFEDLIPIIKKFNNYYSCGVFHSFTGSYIEALNVIEMGFLIGINGASMRTKNSIDLIKKLPIDKIMIESDSPWCWIKKTDPSFDYLCEKSQYEIMNLKGLNKPHSIVFILEIIANIKKKSIEEVANIILKTTKTFFMLN